MDGMDGVDGADGADGVDGVDGMGMGMGIGRLESSADMMKREVQIPETCQRQ
jgi:hypothetical protein